MQIHNLLRDCFRAIDFGGKTILKRDVREKGFEKVG